MTIDLSNVLTWRDVFLCGVIVGLVLGARGRRRHGERIGAVEQTNVRLETALEVLTAKLLGEASNEGKPRGGGKDG